MKILLLTLIILLISSGKNDLVAAAFPPVKAEQAMVVSADALATQAGLDILRSGGNAIDAAIATAFTLAVTYPNAGNIGGGGFMIYRDSLNHVFALDYREKAPQSASKTMYLTDQGKVIENASTLGYGAAGVPGTVMGLWQAHQRFGRMPWVKLLQRAIELAEKGFVLDEHHAMALTAATKEFNRFSSSKKIFTQNGKPWQQGQLFVQQDIANTLMHIAREGAKGFYTGETAQRIAADVQAHAGYIQLADLQAYQAVWRIPVRMTYRGYTIYSMPPPSSGGVLLSEILNTLELFPMQKLGLNNSKSMQVWIEAERQAYADRAEWLGDPDFVHQPLRQMMSKEYARRIRNNMNLLTAGNSDSLTASEFKFHESDQTTHFSVVDVDGNAVSNTYTLNGNFGCKAVASGTGVLLNNEMDDFSIKPGFPNMFGLVGSKANSIAPQKRMLSSMTPSIVLHGDSLFMVLGSPGGSKIITNVAQVISHVIDQKMNIRQAIEAPRFHHQWKPDTVYLEKNRFSRDTIMALQNAGYKLEFKSYMGYVQGILLHDHQLTGWADPRSNGKVAGF